MQYISRHMNIRRTLGREGLLPRLPLRVCVVGLDELPNQKERDNHRRNQRDALHR